MVGKAIGIGEVRELMERLGITLNYKGFYYAVYAVCLVAEKPERSLLVTKWLYPEVARHYETTVNAVERDIRTVVGIIWRENRKALEDIPLPDNCKTHCVAVPRHDNVTSVGIII